ncbi:hypothetical protein SA20RB_134 [Escherichia phage vB_EcoM_SA20RB]|nr:hypothetical protein 101117BS1_245 [Escherichia phage vB_EcoM-101117BS1]UIU28080.1 hypothetical protein SA20RB_134 [Escherichia phage vB_EcoM_SA20RB]
MSSVNCLITGFESRRFVQTLALAGGTPTRLPQGLAPTERLGLFSINKYIKTTN